VSRRTAPTVRGGGSRNREDLAKVTTRGTADQETDGRKALGLTVRHRVTSPAPDSTLRVADTGVDRVAAETIAADCRPGQCLAAVREELFRFSGQTRPWPAAIAVTPAVE
jgi:hypothetical protein